MLLFMIINNIKIYNNNNNSVSYKVTYFFYITAAVVFREISYGNIPMVFSISSIDII